LRVSDLNKTVRRGIPSCVSGRVNYNKSDCIVEYHPKNTQISTKDQNDFILTLKVNKQLNFVIKKHTKLRERQNNVKMIFFLEKKSVRTEIRYT